MKTLLLFYFIGCFISLVIAISQNALKKSFTKRDWIAAALFAVTSWVYCLTFFIYVIGTKVTQKKNK